MINAKNYFEKVKAGEIVKSKLPETLQKSFDFVDKVTVNGRDWTTYEKSTSIQKTIDLYFEKLSDFLKSQAAPKSEPAKKVVVQKKTRQVPQQMDRTPKPVTEKATKRDVESGVERVEHISLELKFIRRFLNLNRKKKDRNQLRLFINALQKAIKERRITKTSKYAAEIMDIQDNLIKIHSQFKSERQKIEITISEGRELKYLSILGKQVEYQSVKFIKSYISLQGKIITNKQAKNLHNRIATAINREKVNSSDKYWTELNGIIKQLKSFIQRNPRTGILKIEQRELNGLNGILSDCGCKVETNLNGVDRVPEKTILNSLDVVNLNFEKLGFTGKWLELIGNPSKGFSAMIFGKPKMGKSYLAVEFAGYLARNHGKVLYVAREEGIDDTLQEKLEDKNVAHPKLDVSNYLPDDLSSYDFVFLDSVTKLGLSPTDLNKLDKDYPDISFIHIFQTTKTGNFRGNNEFQHDVDVVIEIPEIGKAIQYGRFNQGGSLNIFSERAETENKFE